MDAPAFVAEVAHRIGINEGCKLQRYRDTLGVWTVGYGYNLQRDDARALLRECGANYDDIMADGLLTPQQAQQLFGICLGGIEAAARTSLSAGIYDALSDARRFVILDLEYNLGARGWLGFGTTRAIISEAQQQKNAGKTGIAHNLFNLAGDHLAASAWDGQVGERASRDIAMMRSGVWCDATGDGST